MKMKSSVKILAGSAAVFMALLLVRGVHIYLVTRTKAPDANTKVMVRFDIKQEINQADAAKITAWLYKQNGMDHVLCTAGNHHLVFTFFPVKNSADKILHDFNSSFSIPAERYLPSEEELKSGCPVAGASTTNKAIVLLKRIF